MRLGVNIDHVATVRQARRTFEPSPLFAALLAQQAGAHQITLHLREDRRHIQEQDLELIKKAIHIPINLEMAPTKEMKAISLSTEIFYSTSIFFTFSFFSLFSIFPSSLLTS